ncbi:MAG: nitric oxide reductase activation protein [Gammaproteobacteria bacterium SG8_47]|nr:MAG: nitric oxide reductase activation protein [Gammaproteobacteria bacterium SG8_47]
MDAHLDTVLSSRRTAAGPAESLAALERSQQDFVLNWVESVAHSNAEMAYQFASLAVPALELMDERTVEEWLLRAMDVYDREGLYAGVAALQEVEDFAEAADERISGLALEEVAGVLGLFINGLSGRSLKLQADEAQFTDTETLYLPPMVTRFSSRDDNFRLYKAHAVHLWSQIRFGTFRATYEPGTEPRLNLAEALSEYPDPDRALALLHGLERVRLDACVARELPGVHREMHQLLGRTDESLVPSGWDDYAKRLQRPEARLHDSLEILRIVYGQCEPPRALVFQGRLMPARAEAVLRQRIQHEREMLRRMLVELAEDATAAHEAGGEPARAPRFTLAMPADNDLPEGFVFEVLLDGAPLSVPIEVREVMGSIMLDLGNVPPEFLQAAGAGGYSMTPVGDERSADDVWKGTYHEEGAFLYNEWDFKRNHHRKNWCVLRELDVAPQDASFRDKTLRKYSGLVKELRRTFEALRGEDKLLKKQKEGDDVDIDALVEAIADVKSGMEMTDRLFTKMHKLERNIAVMFMVDMSGSTKGWINDAERESLILLCEALETLGDRYAIYGFSGMTRKKCELFRIKRFDEPYDDAVIKRICGIKPQDYTRMGVTIRHLTKLLSEVEARTKLLVTLSDGKPDDFDGYRGEYGIEDTRQALIEAKQQGIHPFCITIDDEAREYLPHMYGAVNYALVDDVYKLPLKVSDIYRRLTT